MKRRTDEEISAPLYAYDADIRAQYGCFAGVDEAGRGPLCGPVCVAACILDPEAPVYGINDSKKLSEKKREATICKSHSARHRVLRIIWNDLSVCFADGPLVRATTTAASGGTASAVTERFKRLEISDS